MEPGSARRIWLITIVAGLLKSKAGLADWEQTMLLPLASRRKTSWPISNFATRGRALGVNGA